MNYDEVIQRIKNICREKHILYKDLLINCDLNHSFFTKSRTDFSLNAIYKIANYLNVSIDYLTGRTRNKESHILPIIQNLHLGIIHHHKTNCLKVIREWFNHSFFYA